MDSTQRFSNRVENYVKYRPHYPKDIIAYLKPEINFDETFIVADIGSGTGILTEIFLQNKNKTIGVEPNAAMRLKAEEFLNKYANFTSIDATAESTTLENESVDLIVAGQAFHWFDGVKTKAEFQRIAKQNAYCVLIWNERLTASSFEKEYDSFLLKYATDYTSIDHRNITPEKIDKFFFPQPVKTAMFANKQVFDFDGLKGRLLSSSYIPNEENEKYFLMLKELNELFEKYQRNDTVEFKYETKLFLAKMK
jgi:SAM-dependent methyltransferase